MCCKQQTALNNDLCYTQTISCNRKNKSLISSTDMLNLTPRGFLKYCLETFFLVPTSPWAQLYVFSFQMPVLWPSATRVPTCARQLHPRQLKSPISSYSFFNFTYSTPTYTIIAVIMNSKYKILGKVKRERVEKREKTILQFNMFHGNPFLLFKQEALHFILPWLQQTLWPALPTFNHLSHLYVLGTPW